MNRLGFTPTAFRGARARLELLPQVDEISLMTHFSDADGDRGVAHQLAVFEATTADMAGERTLANSAATLRHGADPLALAPRIGGDWVRAGIMSYGSAPDYPERTIADWKLRPAMTLRSKLIGVQQLQAGDTRRLRQRVHGRRPDAHRRGRLRLRRRLSAPRAHRHAGAGRRRAHAHRRPGVDGHDHRRPEPGAATPASAARSRCGATGRRRRCCRSTRSRRPAGTIGYELMCALALRVPVSVG